MRAVKYTEIAAIQLFIVIMEIQRGIGVLTLARAVSKAAGNDGWISVILAGMVTNAVIVLLVMLASRFPGRTIYEYSRVILGRYLGGLVNLLYITYSLLIVLVVFTHYSYVLNVWIYENTPPIIFKIVLLVPAVYAARNGLRVLVRYIVLVFYASGWLLILFAYPLSRINLLNLQPVGDAGVRKILMGSLETVLALLGFEIILVIYPFIEDKKHVLKAVIGGNMVTTFAYTVIAVSGLGFFSQDYIGKLIWPTLTFFRLTRVLGIFERADILFLSIWIFTITTTIGLYLYSSTAGIVSLIGKEGWFKNTVPLVAVVLLIASHFIKDINTVFLFAEIASYYGGAVALGVPVVLLVLAVILKKKERGVQVER